MSERDAAARMLAEEIAEESIFEPGSPRYLGKVARWQDKIAAFLAQREADWRAEADEGWKLLGELWDLCNRYFVGGEDAPIRNWLESHNAEAEGIRARLLKVVRRAEEEEGEEYGWSLAEQMARDAAGEIEG